MKVLPFIFFCLLFSKSTIAVDTIIPNQTLHDNGNTLVSSGENFELGFFSPLNSSNRYIGIWFKKVSQQTVVWVANKNSPLTDSSGILTITITGNIIISNNQSATPIWSSNSSASNPLLQLLDSGNLVVKDTSSGKYIWQSFDHPCDTLIPGGKLGLNYTTGQYWYMTSWKSLSDPSDGDYTYKSDPQPHGLPEILLRRGDQVQFRSGPWDGVQFGGGPRIGVNPIFTPIFVFDTNSVYYTFENHDKTIISRFVLNQTGILQHLAWSQTNREWVDINIITLQGDNCDKYAVCGPNGICNADSSPICHCPTGFTPALPQDWHRRDWSGGCIERTPKNCSADEGFNKFSGVKLPDDSYIMANGTTMMNSAECRMACLRNCSCTAYAKTDVRGCVMWFRSLLDVRVYTQNGQDLYIKMAAAELVSNSKGKRKVIIVSVVVASVIFLVGLVGGYAIWKRSQRRKKASKENNLFHDNENGIKEEDLELPLFTLGTVAIATNNFSSINKLGQGGFGPVYKGKLSTGQEIAVKRLSKDSVQGLDELMNEIILISKLQHRNLVKLLGCCIHGEERMLIYEYMPNKSLDFFIFDQTKDTVCILDWQKRFEIIVGIARGLLYLHRDSRLRIIHRDLKASNILLDHDMQPKISDFGLARMFRADQTEAETNRVIGTFGYMSPEYAIDGLFSLKSDIYSFGVLLLEIVSGERNRGFYHPDHDLNLLGHAWKLWKEDKLMELLNESMENSVSASEVSRCIQVGLLCVQQRPEDRPSISSVLSMLDSDNALLPQPKQPGFYAERFFVETALSTGNKPSTTNELPVKLKILPYKDLDM